MRHVAYAGFFLGCLFFLVCVGGFLAMAVDTPREGAVRHQCASNLKNIGVAMNSYLCEHGMFPPAYVADENGRPMHSWRVLLLPYLGRQDLYDQYDFDEPWDGPHNRKLWDQMPKVYRCPSQSTDRPGTTVYVGVVGQGLFFDGDKSTSDREILDGMSRTIAVVESSGANVNWMQPRDLDFETMPLEIDSQLGPSISSDHPGKGAYVLMADASVHYLSDDLDPSVVRAMLTKAGGEEYDLSVD
jgi:hypothetical protein